MQRVALERHEQTGRAKDKTDMRFTETPWPLGDVPGQGVLQKGSCTSAHPMPPRQRYLH
jgi:hypothetical protein